MEKEINYKFFLLSHTIDRTGAPIFLDNLGKRLEYEFGYNNVKYFTLENPNNQYKYIKNTNMFLKELISEILDWDKYIINENTKIILIFNTISTVKYAKFISDVFKNNYDKLKIYLIIHEAETNIYYKFLNISASYFTKLIKIICPSKNVLIKSYSDVRCEKIIINNGIDINNIDNILKKITKIEARNLLNLDQWKDSKILIMVGTICGRKNQHDFIKYVFEPLKIIIPDLKLIIVGREVDPITEINPEIKKDVLLTGEIPNPYMYLRASDIFVCNSNVECFPLSILEAMYIGVPVISTNIYGIPEIIENNISGLLYDLENYDLCKTNVIKLINDLEIYNKIIKNAYQKILSSFTIDIMFNNYLEQFMSIDMK
jgi:glycosyltransferase involved in cell wall biosynthesis